MSNLFLLGFTGFSILVAIYGWFSDKSKLLQEDKFNISLRNQLEDEKNSILKQLENERVSTLKKLENEQRLLNQKKEEQNYVHQARVKHIECMKHEFELGYVNGRQWLSNFIAEADKSLDDYIALNLKNRKPPAFKASEEVAIARLEKREMKERVKFLEYQLKSYKEYFPFLDEYEDFILDERIQFLSDEDNIENIKQSDPVLRYVSKEEYEKLSSTERNQQALNRYLKRSLSHSEIGRFYERYLGYLYERDGWKVEYHGIAKGFEDLGRDLICKKGKKVLIVQAKCWSNQKVIHEKHIFQLFGTTKLYQISENNQMDLFHHDTEISGRFVTTTSLSPVAQKIAKLLDIDVQEKFTLEKSYPMIKCNINQSSKEKIYHLPFDQQYDRTKIIPSSGEFYAATVAEAEKKGFRRAFRHNIAS